MISKIVLFLFFSSLMFAQNSHPNVFTIDTGKILSLKNGFESGALRKDPGIKRMISAAEKLLEMKPLSVTQKKVVPPSGDIHDYMSMSKYWWPNPDTKDGLPYIRKDGEVNPETNEISDASNASKMISAFEILAITGYITGDEKYSSKALELIRVWFLDKETKMNPNLNYAQFVKGKNEGTKSGVIDLHSMNRLIDGLGLLASSNSWSNDVGIKIREWFKEYLNWLVKSKNGIDESNSKNNHGSWYDVQVVSIALFLGENDLAKEVLVNVKTKRIDPQIQPDGKQPFELVRTTSWDYSVFNLMALFNLARLGERAGIDLWNYESSSGGSIRKALDYVLPFAIDFTNWPDKQIKEIEKKRLYPLLVIASQKYEARIYDDWIKKIFAEDLRNDIRNIL